MIYFSLPNFYENFRLINFFKDISTNHKDWLKMPVTFSCATGNFPYALWNGGFNTNKFDGVVYQDIVTCLKDITVPVRLNCSNVYLNQYDILDINCNMILNIGENACNSVAVSALDIRDYLYEKYPNFNYVFSKEADLLNPFTPDIINVINEQDIFKLIELPIKYSWDKEFLQSIENKNNIEIAVSGPCGNLHCSNYEQCQIHEHSAQYNFSKNNNYENCNSYYYEPIIHLDDIEKFYLPLGFTHFSFGDAVSGVNLFFILTHYFIKDEYKIQIIERACYEGVIKC